MIKIWDTESNKELNQLLGHSSNLYTASFSPDSSMIVSGGSLGAIKIWDVATGREIITLNGHKSGIGSVNFSPKGDKIASGDKTGNIKIWRSLRIANENFTVYPK